MARALAHAVRQPLPDAAELLRLLLVTGCAAALIAAGQALPALGL
ncbi:MAG: hypothetical protein ABL912_03475 [Novosphingobium sp.]